MGRRSCGALAVAGGRRGGSDQATGRIGPKALMCAAIGAACIAGTLVEPVTRRPEAWTVGMRMAIVANIATSVAMIAIGLGSAGA